MTSKVIELRMSDVSTEPVDLLHQVISLPGTVWENPFNPAKSTVDQINNYKKYKHRLANFLFLESEPHTSEYKKLLARAIEKKKLVFECTCFPGPCHLDAVREELTRDLVGMGFNIVTNQKPFDFDTRDVDEEEG